jgi:putative phosphoesterase
MRVAFLSDVHANLPALRAALEVAGAHRADRIVVAGDLVGGGPLPAETIEALRMHPLVEAIRGNVDREVLKLVRKKRRKLEARLNEGSGKRRNRAWTALAIRKSGADWLEGLPEELSVGIHGRNVLVVHGSPHGDEDYVYPSLTPEGLRGKLAPLDESPPDLLVTGHSHIPFVAHIGRTTVVNCGSVGHPADGDPRGSLVLAEITPDEPIVAAVLRFEYPVAELQQAIVDREPPGVDPSEYALGIKG